MTDYRAILREYFGYDDFRGIQLPIIESIGAGRDTLGLMPTGGGKSLTFQVPALAMDGICLVITPLIALMKDQVMQLRKRGIKACAIYSGMSRDEIVATLENCIYGNYKFLYVSPERLSSDIFLIKIKHMKVSFLAVDESHCISQWGYDFRPAYLAIAQIRDLLPDIPVLALTATATPEVVEDIQTQLRFRERNVFRMSFARQNLIYVVRQTEDREAELLHILQSVPGSAIVYVRFRERTRTFSEFLNSQGITATYYHAGLEPSDKDARQQAWTRGDIRVMVATNAFGMGIDKANVRCVLHYEMPDSIEAYFQEAGRAGRDGKTAYAVLVVEKSDAGRLRRRIASNYPSQDFIRRVYDRVCYFYQMADGCGAGSRHDFNIYDFFSAYRLPSTETEGALRILTSMGYLQYDEEVEYNSRLMFLLRRDELYSLQNQTEDEEEVVRTLLRYYPGIFTEYVFIDEHYIAAKSGLDLSTVCSALIVLSRQGVVRYIPARKTPSITFVTDRVDSSKLVFSAQAYDDRLQSYRRRLEAMLGYAYDEQTCRSRLLLSYFGETDSCSCGRCDNCRQQLPSGLRRAEQEKVEQAVMALLADGEWHAVSELTPLPQAGKPLNAVLAYLMSEELVELKEDETMSRYLRKKK